jgi:hypothetical protein
MKRFQNLILNDKLRNIPLDEQTKVQSDIENLISRWYEVYMNQSIITAISSVNGNQLFECECGERYEVEITGATIGSLETSVVEDQEKDGLESKDDGTNRQPLRSFLCPNATCRRSYCSQVISPPAVPFLFLIVLSFSLTVLRQISSHQNMSRSFD